MARLVRFETEQGSAWGQVEGEQVRVLAGEPFGGLSFTGEARALGALKLLPPCRPTKLLAVGFNYRDHAQEFNTPIPEKPNIVLKPLSSLAGPGQAVYYPRTMTAQVEFEAELVVVMGRRARHVGRAEALGYVLGYTVGNDVTARDLQSPTGQWALCKGFDTFGVVGPWVETQADPGAGLAIESFVNGERRQHSNPRHLIFDVPFLVSYLAQVMTLEPGDVIFTGTPSGVGPVAPGDVMEMRIEGIGSLVNPVAAEP